MILRSRATMHKAALGVCGRVLRIEDPRSIDGGAGHHRPHFHAYHQDRSGVVAVDPIEVIAGDLGMKQERLVLAWAELHREAIFENWERLQAGRPALPIEPLR